MVIKKNYDVIQTSFWRETICMGATTMKEQNLGQRLTSMAAEQNASY
jgi:hypothetical protein